MRYSRPYPSTLTEWMGTCIVAGPTAEILRPSTTTV